MEKIISVVTPIFSIISFFLGYYFNNLIEKSKDIKELNIKYLNGLRLCLEETYARLSEIKERIKKEGNCSELTYVKNFDDIKKQSKIWFVSDGCYLISSSYIVACLYAAIEKLKEEYPYIKIKKRDDTMILNKVFKINQAFLKDLSVYYVLQQNIGQIMYKKTEERILNYAEFTELLIDDKMSLWFERLISFMIEVGHGKKQDNINHVLEAIISLSSYLEMKYKLGPAILNRLELEKNK